MQARLNDRFEAPFFAAGISPILPVANRPRHARPLFRVPHKSRKHGNGLLLSRYAIVSCLVALEGLGILDTSFAVTPHLRSK